MDKNLIGKRVELHPATDRWMMGDRYGTIARVGRTYALVHLDKSGKRIKFHPNDLTLVNEMPKPDRLLVRHIQLAHRPGTSTEEGHTMAYRWSNPGEWLDDKIEGANGLELLALLTRIVASMDFDTIQECFQPEMDEDGYFDQHGGREYGAYITSLGPPRDISQPCGLEASGEHQRRSARNPQDRHWN